MMEHNKGNEIDDFFGHQVKRHVWSLHDADWATSTIQHYQRRRMKNPPNKEEVDIVIPKLLHFIWLGPGELKEDCIESWRHHHHDDSTYDDWQIKIWRNADLCSLTTIYNREALDFAMQQGQYGMASDIVRLEILYQYGGVYVDCDYLCVETLNDLASLSFYCGASHVGCIEINNGICGCIPRHPIIHSLRQEIHTWFQQRGQPLVLISSFLSPADNVNSILLVSDMDVCRWTGPGMWTRVLGNMALRETLQDDDVIFPHAVFHPMPNSKRLGSESHHQQSPTEVIQTYATPNVTRAIHLWHCSWQNHNNKQNAPR